MIYLASPYAHEEKQIMEHRFNRVVDACAELILHHIPVFSPIAHNHPIAKAHKMPRTWNFWRKYDLQMLDVADALWIYKIYGWNTSVGLREEVFTAWTNHKIVKWLDPTTLKTSQVTKEEFNQYFNLDLQAKSSTDSEVG